MPETTEQLKYQFLSKDGVSKLSIDLLTKVNSRIQERIVSTVDETSDANHVPSAAAVYSAINKMSHIKFKTITGSIDDVTEPNSSYIYLQRDNEEDKTWMMYIHDEELGWINIGDTEVDLSNYWSKDPDDVEALKVALGLDASIQELKETIKNLPANLLFDEKGDFALYLRAAGNKSIVDAVMGVARPGMYTIYAERGCPDNPVSAANSSFRGIAHITQLENDTPNASTGTQKAYGWIMMFEQEGKAYVNYIRRSTPSGWQCLNDGDGSIDTARLEALINDKVDKTQMVELTDEEISAAVESAYTETATTL